MIVGIDLGTTHSLIAVWQDGQAVLIPNDFGSFLTPSVVGMDSSGDVVVGQLATTLPHSIASFKRYMGSNKTFQLGQESYRPEELSAFVLKSLIRDAEAFLGSKVTDVVITVPAYFNNSQRKATWLAGELAGLKVRRLVNEPTAASLAYGLHQKELETKFLVVDLGGGTFDVSIVEIFSGVMEVRSSAGDNFLGGDDFTSALQEAVYAKLKKEYSADLTRPTADEKVRLRQAIRVLKHQLSTTETAVFSVTLDSGQLTTQFARDTFDRLVQPLLERMRRPIEKALRDARLRPQELDAVVLVGGATRMPVVQNEIGTLLGIIPRAAIHPDEAIALGAAIQSALIERNADLSEVVVTDVCPFTLGTSVRASHTKSGARFLPIIQRNTTIPTSRVQTLTPAADSATYMHIDVYQGESYKIEENILLGEFTIPVPTGKATQESVDVRYSYDANGLLEVEATVLSTGIKKSILIKNQDHNLSETDIAASLEKLKKLKIHPRDLSVNKLLLDQLEQFFELFQDEERNEVASVLEYFHRALNTQNPEAIEEARPMVESFINRCEAARL